MVIEVREIENGFIVTYDQPIEIDSEHEVAEVERFASSEEDVLEFVRAGLTARQRIQELGLRRRGRFLRRR